MELTRAQEEMTNGHMNEQEYVDFFLFFEKD